MKKRARRFPAIYLPALLILGLSAHAEDRTTASAPLPPLPASPAEAQPGPGSAPPGQVAVHAQRPANDRPKHVTVSRRKEALAERAKHHRQPVELPPEGAHGRAAAAEHGILSPPRQVSPSRPEFDSRGGRTPQPSPNDIASAEGSPTGSVPYPLYERRFTYPWPFGSPQAGGFVPAPPGAPPPPFGYYPSYPPPYFSNATPYRYP